MFEKLTNRYFYGKSGQGDFTPSDLPRTRIALFWDMFRVRLPALVRLNLLYVLCFLPAIAVLLIGGFAALNLLAQAAKDPAVLHDNLYGIISSTLLLLFPCIAITGPFTAGASYVTRNWARDEHAFIWGDFKDAVKENWKQALVVSTITGLMPLAVWTCWRFYGQMAQTLPIMAGLQVLSAMIGVAWLLSVTYMHPLLVTYRLKLRDVLRNGLLLGIAKLPLSVATRLLHLLPTALAVYAATIWNPLWTMFILLTYYLLIGLSLSRFVTASVCNGVFDKVINSQIEGAKVNRGLSPADDDDNED